MDRDFLCSPPREKEALYSGLWLVQVSIALNSQSIRPSKYGHFRLEQVRVELVIYNARRR